VKFKKICIRVFALLVLCAIAGCGSNDSNAPRCWRTATIIETENSGDAVVPQIAMDASGNAVAVWFQYDGTRYSIWSNRYTAATGSWGAATLIDKNNAGYALFPQIAMNASGDAVAVWYQYDYINSVFSNICASRYSAATCTWGATEHIESSDTGHAVIPRVAIDASGNALVVWYQTMLPTSSIWSSRFTASTSTWGTPTLIENNDSGYSVDPRIAMDASGNAMVVWFRSDGTRYSIWSNCFTVATGTWGTETLLETDDAGDAQYPQIAIDAFGNAMAIWFQFDGTRNSIYACRYSAALGIWGAVTPVETDNAGDAGYPKIAFDATGNVMAVWHQSDGTRTNIWSSRYTKSTGTWSVPTLLETDNAGDAIYPQIAIDGAGNTVAVWSQYDGSFNNIYSNRYTASIGTWGTPALLETDSRGPAYVHHIAMDFSGNAVVVWNQYDGPFFSIWSNVYR